MSDVADYLTVRVLECTPERPVVGRVARVTLACELSASAPGWVNIMFVRPAPGSPVHVREDRTRAPVRMLPGESCVISRPFDVRSAAPIDFAQWTVTTHAEWDFDARVPIDGPVYTAMPDLTHYVALSLETRWTANESTSGGRAQHAVRISIRRSDEIPAGTRLVVTAPDGHVVSGKTVLRLDDEDANFVDLIVEAETLYATIQATVGGVDATADVPLKVEPKEPRREQEFRFLDPVAMLEESVSVEPLRNADRLGESSLQTNTAINRIATRNSLIPKVRAGKRYLIEIVPRRSDTSDVTFTNVPSSLHVSRVERVERNDSEVAFRAVLEVVRDELMTTQERIGYECRDKAGKRLSHGELFLRRTPRISSQLRGIGALLWVPFLVGVILLAQPLIGNVEGYATLGDLRPEQVRAVEALAQEFGGGFAWFLVLLPLILWMALNLMDRFWYAFFR